MAQSVVAIFVQVSSVMSLLAANELVDARIAEFKSDLSRLTPVEIARKHIVFGDCAVLPPNKYFQLRQVVASQFHIHPNNVLIVGSGKLGFSIAPGKRYKEFGDQSDLDVVIVSRRLFEAIWEDLYRYYSEGGWWERELEFTTYLFRGWIRPDKLPPDHRFEFARKWWSFFDELSVSREYTAARVRGAIYKSWYFLEAYQTIAIADCVRDLRGREGDQHED